MRDDFENLMEAVMRLQDCIRSMGCHAEVAEIRLKPTRSGAGGYEVERAIKAAPSFVLQAQYRDETCRPSSFVAEIMGVAFVDISRAG